MVLCPCTSESACFTDEKHERKRKEQPNNADMAYRTESVEDADFEYIVPRMFEAIGNDYEFINVLYPGHQTQAGQSKITSRFTAWKNSIPNLKWAKAVSVTSEEIVGIAMWTVIDEKKPPETELDGPPGTWPNDEEKKYCQSLHRALLTDRRRVIRENDLPIMSKHRSKTGTLEQYRHLPMQY